MLPLVHRVLRSDGSPAGEPLGWRGCRRFSRRTGNGCCRLRSRTSSWPSFSTTGSARPFVGRTLLGHGTQVAAWASMKSLRATDGSDATIKIKCELLAADRWKLPGKRRIVEHGGCGAGQMHIAIHRNTDLLRESRSSRYSRRKFSPLVNFPGWA
jgi:hypothetical protein